MSLFSEEGVDLPSLDAICARAGFTRGAFYVHFRDRDDFLEAVMQRVLVDFVDDVVSATQSGDDLSETIGRFLRAASEGKVPLMGTHQRLVLHLMTRGLQRDDSMRGQFKLLLEHAMTRIASAVERGAKAPARSRPRLPPDLDRDLAARRGLGLTTMLNFGARESTSTRIQESARELLRIEPR